MLTANFLPMSWNKAMSDVLNPTSAPALAISTYFKACADTMAIMGGKGTPFHDMAKQAEAAWYHYHFLTDSMGEKKVEIDCTVVDGKEVPVETRTVHDRPWVGVTEYKAVLESGQENDGPDIIVFSPYTGHHEILMEDVVKQWLPIARSVRLGAFKDGALVPRSPENDAFDFENGYLGEMADILVSDSSRHALGICQAGYALGAATAHIAKKHPDSQPRSITGVAAPYDTRLGPLNQVTTFGQSTSLEEYKRIMGDVVPYGQGFPGAGREVAPGAKFLGAFVFMNLMAHTVKLMQAHDNIYKGNYEKAKKTYDFWLQKYGPVVNALPMKCIAQNVYNAFMRSTLARGEQKVRGQEVNLGDIKAPVFAIGGKGDDITHWMDALAILGCAENAQSRYQFVHPKAGHYGCFAGSAYRNDIFVRQAGFVREVDRARGITYKTMENNKSFIVPEKWDGKVYPPRPETISSPYPRESKRDEIPFLPN